MFWMILSFGIVVMLIGLAIIEQRGGVGEEFGIIVAGALLIYFAGFIYIKKNNTFLIIDSIFQTKEGYVIYTNENLKIYQKECSYKIGDTLWIKK